MRNLKRVLSLALSAIMLLGLMVMGTGAANVGVFDDADQISNVEAATIVAGLEIFKGDGDNFLPNEKVDRAQMAGIICKILNGSDVDVSNFLGAGAFTDVPDWAEGYVNMCAGMGIVEGYGNGRFGATDPVTAWQASLMLQRALGWWDKNDNSKEINKLNVTSEGQKNCKLYDGLEGISVDKELTRDDVAVMVYNALFAQRVHYDDVRGLYTKDSDRNVVVNSGMTDPANTLAQNIFGLYSVDGVVMANGYTDINLTGKTNVEFADAFDIDGNGRTDADWSFDYATGLDFIGHAVTVYYKVVKKAPVVYAVVDQAELVVETFVPSNLSTHAKDKGFSRDTSDTTIIVNYNMEREVAGTGYKSYSSDPMILISNNSSLTVDYAIILDQELDYVTRLAVDRSDPDEPISTFTLKANSGVRDDTNCATLGTIEEDSYVIYTEVRTTPEKMVVLAPAPVEQRLLTKVDRSSGRTNKLYAEAETFKKASADVDSALVSDQSVNPGTCTDDYAVTKYVDVLVSGEYNLVYDEYNRLIAVSPVEAKRDVNVAYVAQFGYKINTNPSLNDAYALTAHVYFADGTDGVYYVNTDKKTGESFAGVSVDSAGKVTVPTATATLPTTVTKVNVDADDATELNGGIKAGFGIYVKLYDVSVNANNTVTLRELKGQNALDAAPFSVVDKGTGASTAIQGTSANDGISQIKKGVTYLGNTNNDTKVVLYGNSRTVQFYVNGVYGSSSTPLTVGVATGIADIPTIKVNVNSLNLATGAAQSAATDDGFVAQVSATQGKDTSGNLNNYATVNAMLIGGYTYVSAQQGIYFYRDSYTVTRVAANDYTLTYHLYDAQTGEAYDLSYTGQYTNDKDARAAAKTHATGFYEDGGKDIKAWPANNDQANSPEVVSKDQMSYVVDGIFKDYIDVGDVLTLYTVKSDGTTINDYKDGVTIDSKTVFVDLSGNRVGSLEELAQIIKTNQDSWINAGKGSDPNATKTASLSYRYQATAQNGDNTVDVLFIYSVVSPYSKDNTGEGGGSGTVDGTETYKFTGSAPNDKTKLMNFFGGLENGAYKLNPTDAAAETALRTGIADLDGLNANTKIEDLLFFKAQFKSDVKTTDTFNLTIKDSAGQIVFMETKTVATAGAPHCVFYIQYAKTTSTVFANGGNVINLTAPLATGTYTWTINGTAVDGNVTGTFTIGG